MNRPCERSGFVTGLPAVAGPLLAAVMALAAGCDGGRGSEERQGAQPEPRAGDPSGVVGTFTPDAPIDSQSEGRLPAEGASRTRAA